MPNDFPQVRLPKIPRGQLIRAVQEFQSAQESPQHPIALPLFFFLLTISAILDAAGLVPILGTVMNLTLGPMIWLTYYFTGTKEVSTTIRMVLVLAMSSSFVLEFIPGIQALPINTAIALLVYILMHPKFHEWVERGLALAGKVAGMLPTGRIEQVAGKFAKVAGIAGKVTEQAA